jgi:hypothetical protein
VLHHEGAFAPIKRLLRERREKIGVGMRFGGCRAFLQPLDHEFGDAVHFGF